MRDKSILDPCCGSRMMWFDRGHENVVFGDQRSETITVTDRSHGNESGTRTLRIEPDVLMDFRDLPYPDGSFKLVAFDPPHLVRAGPSSWLAAKYGSWGRTGAMTFARDLPSACACWSRAACWCSSGTKRR